MPASARLRRHAFLSLVLLLIACKQKPAEDASDPAKVEPVYPKEVRPDPIAERFCAALHTFPKKRRAECCGGMTGVVVTGECVRMLSAALAAKAVSLKQEDADRCVEAIKAAHEGCAWLGPWPVAVPKVCSGIIRGTLAKDAVCRSSLECSNTMRCVGLDPTQPGKCAPPGAEATFCASAADPLATYTRQDDFELEHPPCEGQCDRGRCSKPLAEGAACTSNDSCGRGSRCLSGRCASGARSKLGEACLGGDCVDGARCVALKCATPKAEGQTCANDAECAGACIDGTCKAACEKLEGLKRVFVPVPVPPTKTGTNTK